MLGITWTPHDDQIAISVPKFATLESSSTKREVLQSIASIFDPLGLFSPVTLLGKHFMQTLWNKKDEWDFKLSEEDCKIWQGIAKDIQQIPTHTFNRFIGLDGKGTYQLLLYSDASLKAYASVIYLRYETMESCTVNLIFSNSRLKKMSILRLELLAIIIGLRCLTFVEQQLKITVQRKIL